MSETSGDAVVGLAFRQRREAKEDRQDLEKEIEKVSFWLLNLAADLKNDPRSINKARVNVISLEKILKLADDYIAALDRDEKTQMESVKLGLEPGPPEAPVFS